jgi:hypothetical protein
MGYSLHSTVWYYVYVRISQAVAITCGADGREGCLLVLPSVASADSFAVLVGYADNLRPSGFFPTPWLGAAKVVSQTPASETLDTGAVRIDNTGATPLTITNFKVTLNGASNVFSIWSSLTINPGQNGIFTQTTSFNFASS